MIVWTCLNAQVLCSVVYRARILMMSGSACVVRVQCDVREENTISIVLVSFRLSLLLCIDYKWSLIDYKRSSGLEVVIRRCNNVKATSY